MNFYKVKPFKVFLKTKEELLKLGYEDNKDKKDFLNFIAGRVVTINLESDDSTVYVCKEYPEYAIYDYFIKGVVFKNSTDDTLPLAAIAVNYNISVQAVSTIIRKSLKKIRKIIDNKNLDISSTAIFS